MDAVSHPAASRVAVPTLLLLVVALVALPNRPAEACMWTPPPPFCGKTLVLSHAVPRVVLLPAGGSFDVDALVYFDLFDFPSGAGLCPSGPYTANLDFTLTCTGGGGGGGSLSGVTLANGYTALTVPVTLAAGPPRLCSLTGTATMTLTDGMEIAATPKAMPTCVGEPAPGLPSQPRIDLVLAGDTVAAVQPGDQVGHTYRITNNDATEAFSGLLTVDMVNTAKMPMAGGPMPTGTGVFSVSDPGLGDNFPIGFEHHLFEGCLPLPPDPQGFTESTITQPIVLPPGDFIDVDVFSRPWGMCKQGSCGQASLVLDGTFDDTTGGLACAGFITAADITAPPQYLWQNGGQVAQMLLPPNPQAGMLPFAAAGLPGPPLQLEMQLQQPELFVQDQPAPGTLMTFSGPFAGPDHGRTQVQFNDDGAPLFLPQQPFDLFGHIETLPPPGAPFQTQMLELELLGGPTGFEQIAPGLEALVGILPTGDPDFASFFDLTFQFNGVAIDDLGEWRDLLFAQIELQPTPTGFDFHLSGTVAPGVGGEIVALELNLDLHGFAFQALSPLLFQDAFESGDPSAWSTIVPPPNASNDLERDAARRWW